MSRAQARRVTFRIALGARADSTRVARHNEKVNSRFGEIARVFVAPRSHRLLHRKRESQRDVTGRIRLARLKPFPAKAALTASLANLLLTEPAYFICHSRRSMNVFVLWKQGWKRASTKISADGLQLHRNVSDKIGQSNYVYLRESCNWPICVSPRNALTSASFRKNRARTRNVEIGSNPVRVAIRLSPLSRPRS